MSLLLLLLLRFSGTHEYKVSTAIKVIFAYFHVFFNKQTRMINVVFIKTCADGLIRKK